MAMAMAMTACGVRPQHPCNLREISLSNCNTQVHLIFIGASTRSCATQFDAVCRFLLTSECSHGYGDGSNVAMRYNNSGAKILSSHSPFFWRNSITDSEHNSMLISSVGSRIPEYFVGFKHCEFGELQKSFMTLNVEFLSRSGGGGSRVLMNLNSLPQCERQETKFCRVKSEFYGSEFAIRCEVMFKILHSKSLLRMRTTIVELLKVLTENTLVLL